MAHKTYVGATESEINAYRAAVSRKMKGWTQAKLEKEDAFARGDEGGWEAEVWREELTKEVKNREEASALAA